MSASVMEFPRKLARVLRHPVYNECLAQPGVVEAIPNTVWALRETMKRDQIPGQASLRRQLEEWGWAC